MRVVLLLIFVCVNLLTSAQIDYDWEAKIKFSPNGQYVAANIKYRGIIIYNVATAKPLDTIEVYSPSNDFIFSDDSQTLIFVSNTPMVETCEKKPPTYRRPYICEIAQYNLATKKTHLHRKANVFQDELGMQYVTPNAYMYMRGDSVFAEELTDNKRLWGVNIGASGKTSGITKKGIYWGGFANKKIALLGNTLLYTEHWSEPDNRALNPASYVFNVVIDVKNNKELTSYFNYHGYGGYTLNDSSIVALANNGQWGVKSYTKSSLPDTLPKFKMVDLETGKTIWKYTPTHKYTDNEHCSADGKYFIFREYNKTGDLVILDAKTGAEVERIPNAPTEFNSPVLSPDLNYIAYFGKDNLEIKKTE